MMFLLKNKKRISIKTILLIFSIMGSITLFGQSLEDAKKALNNVTEIRQIDLLKSKYPNWDISIDKTIISDSLTFPNIINAKIGDIVLKQFNTNAPAYVVKVLSVEKEELCNVKYIYFDGTKYSKSKIDSIRTLIIKRFNKGEKFETLFKEFNMDLNPTGDTFWFYKGMMVDDFDKAVRPRSKGEIFTVDVEFKNWFYVVLKTYDNMLEKTIKSIMIEYAL